MWFLLKYSSCRDHHSGDVHLSMWSLERCFQSTTFIYPKNPALIYLWGHTVQLITHTCTCAYTHAHVCIDIFFEIGSQHSPFCGCPITHYVDLAGLRLIVLPASASWELGKYWLWLLIRTMSCCPHSELPASSGHFWVLTRDVTMLHPAKHPQLPWDGWIGVFRSFHMKF